MFANHNDSTQACVGASHHDTERHAQFEHLESRIVLSTVSWDGEAGTLDWHDPENWSDDTLPGSGDDVYVEVAAADPIVFQGAAEIQSLHAANATLEVAAGELLVSGDAWFGESLIVTGGALFIGGDSAVMNALRLSDGVLTVEGQQVVHGLTTWIGGVLAGSGETTVAGGLWSFGDKLLVLDQHTLNNTSFAFFDGGDSWHGLKLCNEAVVNNVVGATWEVHGDFTIYYDGVFQNAGTLTKYGDGVSWVCVELENTGELVAAAGTIITCLHPYTNEVSPCPCDVTGEGIVGMLDVVRLVSNIHREGIRELAPPGPDGVGEFLDVNGDNLLTARDVWAIIRHHFQWTDDTGVLDAEGEAPILAPELAWAISPTVPVAARASWQPLTVQATPDAVTELPSTVSDYVHPVPPSLVGAARHVSEPASAATDHWQPVTFDARPSSLATSELDEYFKQLGLAV